MTDHEAEESYGWAIPEGEPLGCRVCLQGVYSGTQPRFVLATSAADLLYRCDDCHTWWVGDGRSLHAATDSEAHARFPDQVSHP
jgi:hypothetical protein